MKTLSMIVAMTMLSLSASAESVMVYGGSVKPKQGGSVRTLPTPKGNGGQKKQNSSGYEKQYR